VQSIHDNAIKLGAVPPAAVHMSGPVSSKSLDLQNKIGVIQHEVIEMIPAFGRYIGLSDEELFYNEAYIAFIYDDCVIIVVEGLRYYKAPFTLDANGIRIDPVETWQRVEMTWTPVADQPLAEDNAGASEAAGGPMVQDMTAEYETDVDVPSEKSLDLVLTYGSEIKALGDNKFGGYLVRFGNPDATDLTGDYFTKDTDFDLGDGDKPTAIYYDHGLDPAIGRKKIGAGKMTLDDVGVWLEFQLQRRDEYEKAIAEYAAQGKFGLSSGTAPHLVERKKVGKANQITSWPLGIDASVTPTPAEPRTMVLPLKSYRPAHFALTDIASSNDSIGEAKGEAGQPSQSAEQRARALMLEIDLIELGA